MRYSFSENKLDGFNRSLSRKTADGGATWMTFATLADDDRQTREYSYPAIIEPKPGTLAVTFTSNRSQICFCEFDIR